MTGPQGRIDRVSADQQSDAFDRLRAANKPPRWADIAVLATLVMPFVSLTRPDVWFAAAVAFVPTVAFLLLTYRSLGWRLSSRRQIAERADRVACDVVDTHLVPTNKRDPLFRPERIRYMPAVEFTYEREGTTATSYFTHPDGAAVKLTDHDVATDRLDRFEDQVDGTAYYDAESDQAFLFDDPNTDAYWGTVFRLTLLAALLVGWDALFVLVHLA